jgi:hydrogenase maturation protease
VAGVGNIFLGDDAFGVEVARRRAEHTWAEGVRVADFGIRGLDLAYSLLDGTDGLILIDALARGNAPGTLYVLEAETEEPAAEPDIASFAGHNLDPAGVLKMVRALGGRAPRTIVVGCEPGPADETNDLTSALSPAVEAAVEEAARLVETLVQRMRREVSEQAETDQGRPGLT